MKFGFLAHPTDTGQHNQIRATALLADLYASRRGSAGDPPTYVRLPGLNTVRSLAGATCTGEVRCLPYTAAELLRHAATATRIVLAEARDLAKAGAGIIGLGGATAIVGDRGLRLAEALDVPVTSGNSLTTYAAYHTVSQVLTELDRPADDVVTITGYPGSIGLAMARLLLEDGYRCDLVHRRADNTEFLLRYLPPEWHDRVRLHRSVSSCVADSLVFVGASSAGGLIDPAVLRPGSVVVDVALPRDVTGPTDRPDVLVLDGGLVSAGAGVSAGTDLLPAPTEQLNGCLAETILLALEDRAESFSIGRVLEPDAVREIGAIAARHGFLPAPLASFGRLVDLGELASTSTSGTASRFRRHINPPLHDFYAVHGLDQEFATASGCTLTTPDGTEYLDFVAGYGCLNVGHNHPDVVRGVQRFLTASAPVFVQYVSMPTQAAALAERLCELAPPGLERVFFSNSGAEAIEAAIKLARAATGRERLVYTRNSYHGKTMGALSVTGRTNHSGAFGRLLPDCVDVPYGDLDALAAALAGAAAFVVEPVQGEGGVVLPPPGYLAAAQELCRRAGAVFVVDEIQTGLGRTGTMFACEHDGLRPDVLCVAKSLSGGLVPIGATLATSSVWDAAYGSSSRALLHTSTFGGGNLAAAAGLATLDVLTAPGFLARAATTGAHLRESLRETCAPYGFVAEVRGIGMMNAIAFDGQFGGALAAVADQLITRMPGDLRAVVDTLPDHVLDAVRSAATSVESALGDLLGLRFVSALRERHILAFLTANNNRVLRIQPPLVLAREEADRFVAAVAEVCARFVALAGPGARTSLTSV